MNNYLDPFYYFVDDLLSSELNLLRNELDRQLMQYLYNSIDLELEVFHKKDLGLVIIDLTMSSYMTVDKVDTTLLMNNQSGLILQ